MKDKQFVSFATVVKELREDVSLQGFTFGYWYDPVKNWFVLSVGHDKLFNVKKIYDMSEESLMKSGNPNKFIKFRYMSMVSGLREFYRDKLDGRPVNWNPLIDRIKQYHEIGLIKDYAPIFTGMYGEGVDPVCTGFSVTASQNSRIYRVASVSELKGVMYALMHNHGGTVTGRFSAAKPALHEHQRKALAKIKNMDLEKLELRVAAGIGKGAGKLYVGDAGNFKTAHFIQQSDAAARSIEKFRQNLRDRGLVKKEIGDEIILKELPVETPAELAPHEKGLHTAMETTKSQDVHSTRVGHFESNIYDKEHYDDAT